MRQSFLLLLLFAAALQILLLSQLTSYLPQQHSALRQPGGILTPPPPLSIGLELEFYSPQHSFSEVSAHRTTQDHCVQVTRLAETYHWKLDFKESSLDR